MTDDKSSELDLIYQALSINRNLMKSILITTLLLLSVYVQAESTRVQVYAKGQQYWDVKGGQSLSQICQQLQTLSKTSQLVCQQQILKKNPDAFINNDPNRLILGKRLWLPGSYRSVSKLNSQNYDTQNFNWGSIKTPK